MLFLLNVYYSLLYRIVFLVFPKLNYKYMDLNRNVLCRSDKIFAKIDKYRSSIFFLFAINLFEFCVWDNYNLHPERYCSLHDVPIPL